MPKFLDVHSFEGIRDEDALRKIQQSSTDELGVKHINITFNRNANISLLLSRSSKESYVDEYLEAKVIILLASEA